MVLDRTVLNCRQRVNEVRELIGSRTPAHGKDTIVATTVREAIRSVQSGTRIVADDDNLPWLNQR
jgi:hypothetical protein